MGFCIWDFFRLGRFVLGSFVGAHLCKLDSLGPYWIFQYNTIQVSTIPSSCGAPGGAGPNLVWHSLHKMVQGLYHGSLAPSHQNWHRSINARACSRVVHILQYLCMRLWSNVWYTSSVKLTGIILHLDFDPTCRHFQPHWYFCINILKNQSNYTFYPHTVYAEYLYI